MQANRIGLPHLEHGRIPISARLYSGFSWIADIMLPLYWAGALPIFLSPILPIRTAMAPVLPNTPMRGWSILTTIENLFQQERPQCGGTLRPCMQVCHRWMPIRVVTKPACTSKVRSRWSILLTSEK
jgi:hypothetical protein